MQFIHNSAGTGTDSVDVYVNSLLVIDNLKFEEASEFMDVPAGAVTTIDITPPASTTPFASFTPTLQTNEKYVAMLTGLQDTTGFAPNPEGLSTALNLLLKSAARDTAIDSTQIEMIFINGVTDAPTVDLISQGNVTLADNIAYGGVSNYVTIAPGSYRMNITSAATNDTLARFDANLTAAKGPAVFFTSGFLTPSSNQNQKPLSLRAALATGDVVEITTAGLARLQFIHNSPDPTLAMIDVYLNNTLMLDNFSFLDATPFDSVSAFPAPTLSIAPSTSTSANEAIANFPLNIVENGTYVAILNGLSNPANFAPNPDGLATTLSLNVKAGARLVPSDTTKTELLMANGITDAPALDIVAQGSGTLANNISYGGLTDYVALTPAAYKVDVLLGDSTATLTTFDVGLDTLARRAGVLFAAGFQNPAANQNGLPIILVAAFADGKVVEFVSGGFARLQVIHNVADSAAATVDVYFNNTLLIDNFTYLDATPFDSVVVVPKAELSVAPKTSLSAAEAFATFNLNLTQGGTYVAIMNGVLNPANFAPNPDSLSTALSINIKSGARELPLDSTKTELFVANGTTDSPALAVIAQGLSPLAASLPYNTFTDYVALTPTATNVDVTTAADTTSPLARFEMTPDSLKGQVGMLFTSGFLNPATNQNSSELSLFAALATGKVIELPKSGVALLQLIHNAPDPALAMVDLYVDTKLIWDNFIFRQATPYISAIADTQRTLAIAPSTSTSSADAIASLKVNLMEDSLYIAILNGVSDSTLFVPNPDTLSTKLSILFKNGIRETALDSTKVEFFIVQGIPDAKPLDFVTLNQGTFVQGAKYGTATGYIATQPANFRLFIRSDQTVSGLIAGFDLAFENIDGEAMVLLTSGFLNPGQNQNGPRFELIGVMSNGTVFTAPKVETVVSVEQDDELLPLDYGLSQNFPNPFNPTTTIRFTLPVKEKVVLKIYNIKGRLVSKLINEEITAGTHLVHFNANNLASGLYFYRLQAGRYSQTRLMTVVK